MHTYRFSQQLLPRLHQPPPRDSELSLGSFHHARKHPFPSRGRLVLATRVYRNTKPSATEIQAQHVCTPRVVESTKRSQNKIQRLMKGGHTKRSGHGPTMLHPNTVNTIYPMHDANAAKATSTVGSNHRPILPRPNKMRTNYLHARHKRGEISSQPGATIILPFLPLYTRSGSFLLYPSTPSASWAAHHHHHHRCHSYATKAPSRTLCSPPSCLSYRPRRLLSRVFALPIRPPPPLQPRRWCWYPWGGRPGERETAHCRRSCCLWRTKGRQWMRRRGRLGGCA